MPPEYVLRALRMSLGVFLSLAIGYSVINPQLVGTFLMHRLWKLSPPKLLHHMSVSHLHMVFR